MERGVDETLYAYLERRERELTHQITALRGQLEPRELELAHVQSAKRQLGNLGKADKARFGVLENTEGEYELGPGLLHGPYDLGPPPRGGLGLRASFEAMTIKQLIFRALNDQFRDSAATPMEIRAFVRDAYGRTIDRNSIAPQLSRLKDEGILEQVQDGEKWKWRIKAPRKTPSPRDQELLGALESEAAKVAASLGKK